MRPEVGLGRSTVLASFEPVGVAVASGGIEYHEPIIASTKSGTDVTFFAQDAEFGDYLHATANLDPEGNLTVDYFD